MISRLLSLLLTLTVAVCAFATTVEEVPNVHVEDKTQYVSNPDDILSRAAVDSLNAIIRHTWEASSAELVVVALESIGEEDIDEYATDLFRHWVIGKKDSNNGVLVMVCRDQRRAVIRSGYGSEGVLPDIICGRILRDDMFPLFKKGDYDGGLLKAVGRIDSLLTTEGAIAELKSKYANDAAKEKGDSFRAVLTLAAALAAGMMVWLIVVIIRERDRFDLYRRLQKMTSYYLAAAFLTMGLGLLSLLVIYLVKKYCRDAAHKCPRCGSKMRKLSEDEDNHYLTPGQNTEEMIDSVDYDVWLCDACGTTDIYPFVNSVSQYTECPYCHAIAMQLQHDAVTHRPDSMHEGRGERTYICKNCRRPFVEAYLIPRTATPVMILPGGGGFGHGGGFGGGSFGGGGTGGGGASGGW